MEDTDQKDELLVNQDKKEKSTIYLVFSNVIYTIILLSIVLLVQRYVVQPVQVNGSSMEPTLNDENHLLLEKLSYRFSNPDRFDIIVFTPYEDKPDLCYIKRIIGLPGERIKITHNQIYIDDKRLEESYGMDDIIWEEGIAKEEITLGKGEYFVLGDNRNNSKDSRDESIGAVSEQSILGKVVCRIWPLNKIGVIQHK